MREGKEDKSQSQALQGRRNQPGEEKVASVRRKEKPRRTGNLDTVTRRKMNKCESESKGYIFICRLKTVFCKEEQNVWRRRPKPWMGELTRLPKDRTDS